MIRDWDLWWLLTRCRLYSFRNRIKTEWVRRNLCANGWHSLTINYYGRKEWKKKMVKVEFLRCRVCEYKFFASKKDRDKYLKLNPRQNPLDKSPAPCPKEDYQSVGSGGDL